MGSERKQREAGDREPQGSEVGPKSRRGRGLAAQGLGVVGIIVVAWLKYGDRKGDERRDDHLKECTKEHFSGIVIEVSENESIGVSEVSLSGNGVVNMSTDNNGHFAFAACPDSMTPHKLVVRVKKVGYREGQHTVGSTQSATLILERKAK